MSGNEARAWVAIGQHDEDTAILILHNGGHPDMGVYHVHQATEKLLKALCHALGSVPAKTHHLDALLSALQLKLPELTAISRAVVLIDRYLPMLRYPQGTDIELHDFESVYSQYLQIKSIVLPLILKESGEIIDGEDAPRE